MLSHFDRRQQPAMVDVSAKAPTERRALAQSIIQLPPELAPYWRGADFILKKGPVLQTAIIAGTMAVKKTAELIPFCHSLPLEDCRFTVETPDPLTLILQCEVKTTAKTGVEMEALCGVSVAALTVYDMCKSVSKQILIRETRLLEKSGGKSDVEAPPLYGLVLTGGQSRRMGQDKALMDYRGRPHAQYLYDLLSQYCEKVFISARPRQWQGTVLESLPTLPDREENLGPLGGLLTALSAYPQANWLVLACDLAAVDDEIIENLLNQVRPGAVATCYQNPEGGFPEALCAVYTPQALTLFQRGRQAGILCPVKLLQLADCHLIPAPHPGAIANANTPEDYENISGAQILR
ncbi:MAG: cyclic pyranopterin monophosphate synthase MoaC [Cyanobacteria bacterium RI_101]|nr:cyclic pyranopterin monophosphate synthase MoaC [Cyanobacteria bacterium RI_101]